MTTNVGQALPGFAPAHAGSKSAAGTKGDDKSFGELVRGEHPSTPKSQAKTEAGPHDPRWAKRTSAGPGKSETPHTETGKTAAKSAAGKAAKEHVDGGPDKASA